MITRRLSHDTQICLIRASRLRPSPDLAQISHLIWG
jgi:hypothetical protein